MLDQFNRSVRQADEEVKLKAQKLINGDYKGLLSGYSETEETSEAEDKNF